MKLPVRMIRKKPVPALRMPSKSRMKKETTIIDSPLQIDIDNDYKK